jgi:hypothetical protein
MVNDANYWDLVDPIWEQVSIYDGGEAFLAQFQEISSIQRVLFASHWAYSEIQNGGLHQFFSNSTGVLAPEAVAGFRSLGMERCAVAISSAMKFFSGDYPREKRTRGDALDAYQNANPEAWNPFEDLDEAFYDAADSENCGFIVAATVYANQVVT